MILIKVLVILTGSHYFPQVRSGKYRFIFCQRTKVPGWSSNVEDGMITRLEMRKLWVLSDTALKSFGKTLINVYLSIPTIEMGTYGTMEKASLIESIICLHGDHHGRKTPQEVDIVCTVCVPAVLTIYVKCLETVFCIIISAI